MPDRALVPVSMQSESRLKPFYACPDEIGQAPATLEPLRASNKNVVRAKRHEEHVKLELVRKRAEAYTSPAFSKKLKDQLLELYKRQVQLTEMPDDLAWPTSPLLV